MVIRKLLPKLLPANTERTGERRLSSLAARITSRACRFTVLYLAAAVLELSSTALLQHVSAACVAQQLFALQSSHMNVPVHSSGTKLRSRERREQREATLGAQVQAVAQCESADGVKSDEHSQQHFAQLVRSSLRRCASRVTACGRVGRPLLRSDASESATFWPEECCTSVTHQFGSDPAPSSQNARAVIQDQYGAGSALSIV